jgi:tripartite ATP-independent transporter DctP family solute receptor
VTKAGGWQALRAYYPSQYGQDSRSRLFEAAAIRYSWAGGGLIMDKKAFSFLVVGLLLGVLTTTAGFAWYVRERRSPSGDTSARVLKLAHSLDQSHPVHKGMEFMARRLAELSGGAMRIEIFPNEQLGNETEAIEQVQRGAVAMTKTSTASLESFIPQMAVFGVPYIFRDAEHSWKVLEGPLGHELLLVGESHGVRGLCYYDAGSRNFYTIKTPILAPDSLKGLKIRVMKSKTSMDMVQALGAAPTPIPWGELYTALQQGMVDGAENNPPSFVSNRHYEVCKHFSLDEHTIIPDILLVSESVWLSLPPQEQAWLQQAADESRDFQRTLWADETHAARDEMQKQGVAIHEPDRQPFIDKVQALHRSYDGTELGELLRRIKEDY